MKKIRFFFDRNKLSPIKQRIMYKKPNVTLSKLKSQLNGHLKFGDTRLACVEYCSPSIGSYGCVLFKENNISKGQQCENHVLYTRTISFKDINQIIHYIGYICFMLLNLPRFDLGQSKKSFHALFNPIEKPHHLARGVLQT